MIGFYVLIALVVLALLFAKMAIVIIPQSETRIIERLGRYYATLKPGINIIIPFIDKAKVIVTYQRGRYTYSNHIDLREQVYDFDKQNVITKDNIQMQINALLYFQITDPKSAVYEVADLPNAIEKLTQTTLRNVIGELELDESLSSRDTINSKLTKILDEATDKWGVKVNRVELKDITPPKEIRETMEKQMRAERDRRAAILMAEGDKQSKILEAEGFRESEVNKAQGKKDAAVLMAEGEAEAKIKRAEAEAESIRIVTEAFGNPEEARNYLVAMKYIDTLGEMVTGQDNKVVYMPYEATGVLSSLGTMKELFQKTNG